MDTTTLAAFLAVDLLLVFTPGSVGLGLCDLGRAAGPIGRRSPG